MSPSKTSTVKCAYRGCESSYKSQDGIKMFRFSKTHHQEWLVNSGNASLIGLSPSKLYKNKKICEKHFKKTDILSSGRLVRGAIPVPFENSLVEEPLVNKSVSSPKVYVANKDKVPLASPDVRTTSANFAVEMSPSVNKWISTASPNTENKRTQLIKTKRCLFSSPTTSKMAKKLDMTTKKLAQNRTTITRLKREIMKSKGLNNALSKNFKSKESATLCRMQVRKRGPWKKDEKQFAIALYLKSPSAYLYLRKKLVLPAKSTINGWLSTKKMYKTGFNKDLVAKLKLKASTMTKMEKDCIVMFDEMAIKRCLEYNSQYDLIEGFQDIGCFGRSPEIGKQASVFMVRGMYYHWKLPVGYFISENGLKSGKTKDILKQCVDTLTNIGFCVKDVVCDQCPANTSAYRQLGVTEDEPYWTTSSGEKVFAMYDTPHLIKSLRNNLLTHNFLWEGKVVSFQDIRDLYRIDSNSQTTRCAPKLTVDHIYPGPFNKMKVSLATQVFSHSVSAALKTAERTKQISSKTVLNTAGFCQTVNTLFDAMNSKTKKSNNPDNCALSKSNPHIRTILENAIEMFKNLKKINAKFPEPPCFKGFTLTIRAILELFSTENCDFLLTSRFNQDPIENLFSSIRARGGCNKNPSVRIFRSTIRTYTLQEIVEPPKSSSYEPDFDQMLQVETEENSGTNGGNGSSEDDSMSQISSLDDEEDSPTEQPILSEGPVMVSMNDNVTLEQCSQTYFAGYLVHTYHKRYNCQPCLLIQCDPESTLSSASELLLLHRSFSSVKIDMLSGLMAPSDCVMHVVTIALQIYKTKFHKIAHKNHLIRKLTEITKKVVSLDSLTCIKCVDRSVFFLEFLFKVLIYKQCKWTSDNFKTNALDKLKILKHV